MTTTTTRLDEIDQRQRTSRSRDLAFAILIGLGALSYTYVERPAQSWLRTRLELRPAHAT